MGKMKLVCLSCALAFYACLASAEEPTIINEPGKPIAAVFPSGNRAELRLARAHTFLVPIEFQVTENACTTGIGQKFELKIGMRLDVYSWIWREHKDAAKIDKGVTYKLPDGQIADLTLALFMGNASRYLAAGASAGLPRDEISFSDGVSWIPGLEDGVFRKFTMESWQAEGMIPNPQTGQTQNRIVSGELGIGILPDGGGVRGYLEHSDRGAFFLSLNDHGFFLLGDVVTWHFRNGPSSTCQIGFKPNVAKAQQAIGAYVSSIKFEFKPLNGKQESITEIVLSDFSNKVRNAIE